MGDLLAELGLPQVILVSHERQLEGIADRVIRVRKRDGVSVVEESDFVRPPPDAAPSRSTGPQAKTGAPARRRKIRRLTDLDGAVVSEGSAQAR